VGTKVHATYRHTNHLTAQAELEDVVRQLADAPRRRGQLREALAETLSVMRLGVPPTLARTLLSTNPIKSMIEISRDHGTNVRRWRDREMVLRWCAAGMVEASKQFRPVNRFMHLPALRKALDKTIAEAVTPIDYNKADAS
jgi:hypothetical protein